MNQNLIKFNLACRKIHRFLVIFSLITFLVMAKTGLIIKYRWFYQETTHGSIMKIGFFTISDQSLRRLHSDYSLYFTIIIGLMMITGIYLYLYPKLAARERDKETSNEPQTNNPKM